MSKNYVILNKTTGKRQTVGESGLNAMKGDKKLSKIIRVLGEADEHGRLKDEPTDGGKAAEVEKHIAASKEMVEVNATEKTQNIKESVEESEEENLEKVKPNIESNGGEEESVEESEEEDDID